MTFDPDSPTTIHSAVDAIEAAAVVAALEAEGIKATTTGSYTSGFQAEAPGEIQIVVQKSHADQARAILEQLEDEADHEEESGDE
jgi:Putative prokaryotic signal transducing protein